DGLLGAINGHCFLRFDCVNRNAKEKSPILKGYEDWAVLACGGKPRLVGVTSTHTMLQRRIGSTRSENILVPAGAFNRQQVQGSDN
ncbi:hypothetical protein LXJ58_30150, partial [Escherichia coli]|nr:hypothetical protein [Escherichia coli]